MECMYALRSPPKSAGPPRAGVRGMGAILSKRASEIQASKSLAKSDSMQAKVAERGARWWQRRSQIRDFLFLFVCLCTETIETRGSRGTYYVVSRPARFQGMGLNE